MNLHQANFSRGTSPLAPVAVPSSQKAFPRIRKLLRARAGVVLLAVQHVRRTPELQTCARIHLNRVGRIHFLLRGWRSCLLHVRLRVKVRLRAPH